MNGWVRRSPLTIAGLWDEWKDVDTGEPLKSCTMIITEANDFASKIHDRMPVLLQPNDFDRWLVGTAGTELLKPASNDYLQAWPVSRRVHSSRAPSDDCCVTGLMSSSRGKADIARTMFRQFRIPFLLRLKVPSREPCANGT
jgi:putative SOS response-associated peptidase YedK